MKELQIGNKTYIPIEVPEGARDFWITNTTPNKLGYTLPDSPVDIDGVAWSKFINLPDGKYKIMGQVKNIGLIEKAQILNLNSIGKGINIKILHQRWDALMADLTPNTLLIEKVG